MALLILFIFNLIFFSTPILKNLYFSPADILQRFSSFNLDSFYLVKNSLLFDPVTQFHPWFKLGEELMKNLHFPLWNPLSGAGVPLFANTISALFFPLSFFYYFFDFRIALIFGSFTKLYLIGVFTYLYLRELGLRRYSSLVGATSFNFAGFNIVWLLWPHTNEIIFLPLLFLLIEKTLKKSLRWQFSFVWLALSFMFLFLAGHPETFFHIILITFIYFFFRLFLMTYDLKQKIFCVCLFSFSFLIGIFLSAFQLLPFLEYLSNSFAIYQRTSEQFRFFLPFKAIILNIFPNLFGNPSTPFYRPIAEFTNYNETVGGYVGMIVLFLSFLAIIFLIKKDSLVRFFSILAIFLLVLIYGIPSRYMNNSRLLFALAFSLSVLAAKFINALPAGRKLQKLILGFFGLIILFFPLSIFLLENFGMSFLSSVNPDKARLFLDYEKGQISFIFVSFLLSLLLLYGIALLRNKKKYFIVGIAFLIFLQTGFLNKNYNPSIEKKYFYPETEGIKFLKNLPQGRIMELGGNLIFPPNVNLWYNLPNIQNYDALNIKRYKLLFDKLFDKKTEWGTILTADNQFMDLFGVRYILSNTSVDKKIILNQTRAEVLTGELLASKELNQTFLAKEKNLRAVVLLPANYNRFNTCHFIFKLSEATSNKEIFQKTLDCNQIFDKSFFEIDFPKITGSLNRQFKFSLVSSDATFGNAISFWADKDGELVFLTVYEQKASPGLKLIYNKKFKIYENQTFSPSHFFVTQAVVLEEKKILPAIKEKRFDLKKTVILEEGFSLPLNSLTNASSAFVDVLEEEPDSYKVKIESKNDGYLVADTAYFPGWKVFIDGRKTKLLRANYAFSAVFVSPGVHIIEFIYRPGSFIIGLAISALALVFISIIFIYGIFQKR